MLHVAYHDVSLLVCRFALNIHLEVSSFLDPIQIPVCTVIGTPSTRWRPLSWVATWYKMLPGIGAHANSRGVDHR